MASLDGAKKGLSDASARAAKAVGDAHGAATKVSLSSSQVIIGMCGLSIGGGAPWVVSAFFALGAATAPLSGFGAVLGLGIALLMARGKKVISGELDFENESRRMDALIARRDKFKPTSIEYKEINEEIRASYRLLFHPTPPLALPPPPLQLPAPAAPKPDAA